MGANSGWLFPRGLRGGGANYWSTLGFHELCGAEEMEARKLRCLQVSSKSRSGFAVIDFLLRHIEDRITVSCPHPQLSALSPPRVPPSCTRRPRDTPYCGDADRALFPLKGNAWSLPQAPCSALAAPQRSCLCGRQQPAERTHRVCARGHSEDRGQLSH